MPSPFLIGIVVLIGGVALFIAGTLAILVNVARVRRASILGIRMSLLGMGAAQWGFAIAVLGLELEALAKVALVAVAGLVGSSLLVGAFKAKIAVRSIQSG